MNIKLITNLWHNTAHGVQCLFSITPEQKWAKKLAVLVSDVPEDEREMYEILLTNAHTFYHAQPDGKLKLIEDVYLKFTKTVFEYIRMKDFVAVQPISKPEGTVFRLERVTDGDVQNLKLISRDVHAHGKPLQYVSLHLESLQDMKYFHGEEIEEDFLRAFSAEVANEIDTMLIDAMRHNAMEVSKVTINDTQNFDKLLIAVTDAQIKGSQKTRRGLHNRLLASPMTVSVLESSAKNNNIPYKKINVPAKALGRSIIPCGILEETITVYMGIGLDNDNIILGYKGGKGEIDTGLIWTPYLLLYEVGIAVDPKTFAPAIQFDTSYDLDMVDNDGYYVKIPCDLQPLSKSAV